MTATFPNILLLALVGFACAQLLHSSCCDLPSRPSCKLAPPPEPHPKPPRQKTNSKTRFSAVGKTCCVLDITGLLLQSIPTKKTPVNRDHHLEFQGHSKVNSPPGPNQLLLGPHNKAKPSTVCCSFIENRFHVENQLQISFFWGQIPCTCYVYIQQWLNITRCVNRRAGLCNFALAGRCA